MTAPYLGKHILDLSAFAAQRPHALATAMACKLLAAMGASVFRPIPASGDPFATLAPILPDGSSAVARFLLTDRIALGSEDHSREVPFDAAIGDYERVSASDALLRVRFSVFSPGDDPAMSELGLMALSGILDATPSNEGEPHRLGGHQPAYAAGLAAFTAAAAGLRTSRHDFVDISLFDVACWLNWKAAATVVLFGREAATRDKAQRGGWHTMRAKDGHIALVYMNKDWPALCDLIGDEGLQDARFASQKLRGENMVALNAIMAPWFAARTRAEITNAAQAQRIPIGPVLTLQELLSDRQHSARKFLMQNGEPRTPLMWDGHAAPWRDVEVDNHG